MNLELQKLIVPREGFQSSVNLVYDLDRADKMADFVPTRATLSAMEELLLAAAPNATERAHILIGAYGKGKSHLVLVLLGLLSGKNKEALEPLMAAIHEYKPALAQFIEEQIVSPMRPFVPIVIDGSQTDLVQSFLAALQIGLEHEGLEDLMPETYFEAALRMIERWQKEFPATYRALEKLLPNTIKTFKTRLSAFDAESYEFFVENYPQLTSGGVFNPFQGMNIVDLYAETAKAVQARGYRGLYVVYDEFSKYLEANITTAGVSETRLLQDFAERAGRSGSSQLQLLLIAHKDISNYLEQLPKNKVDGWKGVSERFRHIELRNSFAQSYELIGRVLKKEKSYTVFYSQHAESFHELMDMAARSHVISDAANIERIVTNSYPLHPATLFLLPRLSDLIAQNERTLFTFLSRDSKFTMVEYLRQSHSGQVLPLLTPDWIYDYFEPIFRQEPYTSPVYKLYRLAAQAITQIGESRVEIKLIKTLTLIYMVNHFEQLPPTGQSLTMIYAFTESGEDIAMSLESLTDKKHLLHKSSGNGYLRLKEASGIDVRQKCRDLIERNKMNVSVLDILSQLTKQIYFYPTRYNDEFEMTRYFELRFIRGEDFLTTKDWQKRIDDDYLDGVVFALLPDSPEAIRKLRAALSRKMQGAERCLFILPRTYQDVTGAAYTYQAARTLMEEAEGDTVLQEEYRMAYDDASDLLEGFLQGYLQPELGLAEYYYDSSQRKVRRRAQFSQQLSDICQRVYTETPIINNEALNRNSLTTVAQRTRDRLIEELLQPELRPMLGQNGSSQAMSFIRSALLHTEILYEYEGVYKLSLSGLADPRIEHVMNLMEDFISQADGTENYSFSWLYQQLRSAENHIAMKKGPIPLLVAVVIHFYSEHLVIYSQGEECELTASLLRAIEVHPENYTAFREDWDDEKADYINCLGEIFAPYVLEREREYGSFSFLVHAMQRWFLGLPNYTKQGRTHLPTEDVTLLRSLSRARINPREYLFEQLPAIFVQEKLVDAAVLLEKTKIRIDADKEALVQRIRRLLIDRLGRDVREETSLRSAIADWVELLSSNTCQHVFPGITGAMMTVILQHDTDELSLTEQLARAGSGLRLDDWDDAREADFEQVLQDFVDEVRTYDSSQQKDASHETIGSAEMSDDYQLQYRNEDGEVLTKGWSRVQANPRSRLLRNELDEALQTMGASLSQAEKRQVLIETLADLL